MDGYAYCNTSWSRMSGIQPSTQRTGGFFNPPPSVAFGGNKARAKSPTNTTYQSQYYGQQYGGQGYFPGVYSGYTPVGQSATQQTIARPGPRATLKRVGKTRFVATSDSCIQQKWIYLTASQLAVSDQQFYNYNHGSNAPTGVTQKRPKVYSAVGKTAAMILNELYPDFKDQCTYKSMIVNKLPRFECTFVADGKTFSAEGSSKKASKQLACEAALKVLRPDITLDVSVASSEAKKLAKYGFYASEKAADTDEDKEAKTRIKYTPQFSFTEVPSTDAHKTHLKRFQCTLTMPDQGKVFVHEGVGKAPVKNTVIRKALVEIFDVKMDELKELERKAMHLRPGRPTQVLLQALTFYDRTVQMEVDTTDGKPVDPKSRFVCKITLDNTNTIIGPEEDTKQKAKDAACLKVLTEELGLSMPSEDDSSLKRAATVLSPPYALYQLMLKQNRRAQPDVVYDEPQDIGGGAGQPPMFKCTLTVSGTHKFEGIGQSKKVAKSAAAEKALTQLFKFDLNAENAIQLLTLKKMKSDENPSLCTQVCSHVRLEYESICHLQGCPQTTHIAAFVLVSPDGQCQTVSLGAGRNAVINGRTLAGAHGNVLIHMQSAVLARRGLVLYLHKQLEHYNDPHSVVEKCSTTNKFRLKDGYKIVLYTSFPPNTRTTREKQKLSCYCGGPGIDVMPDKVQNFDDMANSGCVNTMSIADKMLKWNCLGLQGSLLSYIMEPIFISHYYIATPSDDKAVAHAVLLRWRDARKSDLVVKSSHEGTVPHGEMYHNWIAGIGTVERLDPYTGQTVTGSPSRLCKFEMYESWTRVMSATGSSQHRPHFTYAEAKKNAEMYQSSLDDFMKQLSQEGLGQWQRKDPRIDNFQLASFDE